MSRMKNRERVWEATRAAARQLGELVSAKRGESLWLRDYPAGAEGDVGRVVVGVAHRGVHRSCAVVCDLGVSISISVEVQRKGASVLCVFRGNEQGLREASDAIAGALEAAYGASVPAMELERELEDQLEAQPASPLPSPPLLDDDEQAFRRNLRLLGAASTKDQRPGLLDAGYAVLDVLGQLLAVPEGRWRLELWGEAQAQSGASISLVGGPHQWEHLVGITVGREGAVLRVPGAAMGAAEHVLKAPTVAALAGLLGNVGALVRQAVDGRAGFRARALSAPRVAQRLAEALRGARLPHAVAVGGSDEGFPRRWPRAQVVERTGGGEHPLIELEEGAEPLPASPGRDGGGAREVAAAPAPFVALTIDDHTVRIVDEGGLAALLPDLLARAQARAARLTPARLALEQVYEVISPFHGLSRGARLRYAALHSDPRGEQYEYRFASTSGGAPISLVEYRDDEILRELHRYLARAAG
jgi:hypothetical protein